MLLFTEDHFLAQYRNLPPDMQREVAAYIEALLARQRAS